MMRMSSLTCVLALATLAVACSEYASVGPHPIKDSGTAGSVSLQSGGGGTFAVLGGTSLAATIQFGQPNVGSPFPPTSGHDQSAHAVDNLVPRTVVIDKGGTVTFNAIGIHQVAIYEPGTEPEDIDTTVLTTLPAGCPPLPLMINDSTGLVHRFSPGCGPRTLQWTFTEPGRYLVICAFLPHFQVGMYGWVIVRDR